MKRISIIILPLFFIISCETKISGPVETEPQVVGVKLKWIGYKSGDYGYVWYVGSEPNVPSYFDIRKYNNETNEYDYGVWRDTYKCVEIELFQSEGYFNFKFSGSNSHITNTYPLYEDRLWIWEE